MKKKINVHNWIIGQLWNFNYNTLESDVQNQGHYTISIMTAQFQFTTFFPCVFFFRNVSSRTENFYYFTE